LTGGALSYRGWAKAELHSHLDGAVRPATIAELAAAAGLDRRGLAVQAPDDCPSQLAYIAHFEPALAVLQTEEALERAARELGEDSALDGVDYLEVRWAPRLHLRQGLAVRQVIAAVLRGLAAAPLRAVAIVCAMRNHPADENVELAREAGRFAGRGVVGFDLAGDEAAYPAAPQALAFAAARAAGLGLTCHAGEAGDPANVEAALDLGVSRIAHGVNAARVPAIVERLKREGVTLDLCPTANWKCKAVPALESHPLPQLLRAGVRCTISTDSRTVAGTTLSKEFELASTRLEMTDAELLDCDRYARAARFDR
jgi:adenosine deaminase